ncbi:MAG: hypothetical protein ABII90_05770 [Bacteroidota bacterium]
MATFLSPGDTLYLCDGVYTTANSGMLSLSNANGWPDGTSDAYITVKGLHANCDGGHAACAIIDGQSGSTSCTVSGMAYYNIEDLQCEDSSDATFKVTGSSASNPSSYVNVRRVSAYNAATAGGKTLFSAQYYSDHILFEDTIASQKSLRSPSGQGGRMCWMIFNGASNVTVRRGYCNMQYINTTQPCVGLSFYSSSDSLVENTIFDFTNATCSGSYETYCITGQSSYHYNANNKAYGNVCFASTQHGWNGFDPETNKTGDLGSPYDHNSWEWYHNVVINLNSGGFWHWDADDYKYENQTIVNHTRTDDAAYFKHDNGPYTYNCTGVCGATLKNNSFLNVNTGIKDNTGNSVIHTYNNIYNTTYCYKYTDPGEGDRCNSTNPEYDTSTYGKGAYLMVPTALQSVGEGGGKVGAEVLYRYQEGTISETPLWPWPMEDRIKKETGISVTYESGGGIWKTLKGVYADNVPPSAPTGLTVN